ASRRSVGRFFFQAEDGIRDFHVTGVQTCALPIYASLAGGDRGSRQGFAVSASRGPAECDGGPRPWTGGSGGLAEGGRGAVPRAVPRVGFVVDDAALNDAAGTGPRVTARGGCAGDVILQGEQVCFHAGAQDRKSVV